MVATDKTDISQSAYSSENEDEIAQKDDTLHNDSPYNEDNKKVRLYFILCCANSGSKLSKVLTMQ